jgi:hypothetical protein
MRMRSEIDQLKIENQRMQQFFATLQQQQNQLQQQQQQQNIISSNSNGGHSTGSVVSSPSPASSTHSSNSIHHQNQHQTTHPHPPVTNNNLSLSMHNVVDTAQPSFLLPSTSGSCSSGSGSVSCSLLKSPNHRSSSLVNHSSSNNPYLHNHQHNSIVSPHYDEDSNSNTALLNNNENNSNSNGKKVPVSIYLGDSASPLHDPHSADYQVCIGLVSVCTRTKWDVLETSVSRQFKDYINRLDAATVESGGLGLTTDSIEFFYVGDMYRPGVLTAENEQQQKLPDLLPYGYLVGNHTSILIKLKDAGASSHNSIDQLSYDTLVPKSVLQRYVSLVTEHKNLLLCGPQGTNKSYIARKLAEFLVKRERGSGDDGSLIYFDVANRSSHELKQFLGNLALGEEVKSGEQPPLVLILDNLQNVSNISDAFSDYFSSTNPNKWYNYFYLFK